jgi:hypothetical protein
MPENSTSKNNSKVYSSLRILISIFVGALLGIYIVPAISSYLFGASVLSSTVYVCSLSLGLLVTSIIYNIFPLLLCQIMPLRYLPQYLLEEGLKDYYPIALLIENPNNIELVKIAVARNGRAVLEASEDLANNIDVVKIAVAQNGWALEYASEELRNNIEVVKLAVAQDGRTLMHASEELRNNIDVVKIALAENGRALKYASIELRNNIDVVKIAVALNGRALLHASKELRNNIEVVKLAVAQDGRALEYASEDFRQNKEVVSIALLQNKAAIQYVPGYENIADRDILPSAIAYLKTVSASCFFKVDNSKFKNYMQLLCSNLIMRSRQRYGKDYLDPFKEIASYLTPIDAAALAGVSKSVNCMDVTTPETSAIAVDKTSCPELASLNSILSHISKN